MENNKKKHPNALYNRKMGCFNKMSTRVRNSDIL